MAKGDLNDITTVTVIGSRTVARPDDRTAIVLTLKEAGPIAFEVTLETIAILRRELDLAESCLRRATGRA